MIYKRICILVLILIAFNGTALAKEWVIGGSLAGLTNADEDGLLNSQLQDSGLNATASTSKSIRVIWNLFAGYHFTKDWGAEIAYLDLGKVETTFTGTSVDIDTFLNSAQEIHPQTAQGWLLSVNRFFPLDHDTRMKLRAGLYSWTADYTLQGSNTTRLVSESSTDLSYGLSVVFGRCYKKGTLGYISLDQTTVDETDFSVLGFGFSYCFK